MAAVLPALTLFVVGFSLATAANNRVSKEKLAEAAMVAVNDCRDKEGATDADINMLKQHRLPATKEGLCMMECLFNTAGIMKDGKLDKAGAIEFCTPAMKGDVAKIKKMEEMMDLCEKEAGEAADACEAAKVVAVCTARRGKEFGFVMNNPIKS